MDHSDTSLLYLLKSAYPSDVIFMEVWSPDDILITEGIVSWYIEWKKSQGLLMMILSGARHQRLWKGQPSILFVSNGLPQIECADESITFKGVLIEM